MQPDISNMSIKVSLASRRKLQVEYAARLYICIQEKQKQDAIQNTNRSRKEILKLLPHPNDCGRSCKTSMID